MGAEGAVCVSLWADLAAGCDRERLHACTRVVALLLAEPWVQHIDDAFDGEGSFCNVCCHNHLSERTASPRDPAHLDSLRKHNAGRVGHREAVSTGQEMR